MENEIKILQKQSDKAYKSIYRFVVKYAKNEKEIVKFFKNLNEYLDAEIELDKLCNG